MKDNETKIAEYEKENSDLKREIQNLKQILELKDHQLVNIFANLSHELRTPLNGLNGFSELLGSLDISCEEVKLYTSVILESSNMLMDILNDAFDIVKIEAETYKIYPEAFDLNELIFDIYLKYKPEAEKKNLQFFLENLIGEEYIIESSRDSLQKVLSKLIENAIKYTKQGWVKVKYDEIDNQIWFNVEDSGIGVNKAVQSKLFHSFVSEQVSKSRHVSGTGLDLTLCSGLVNLLGGIIQYYPGNDQGSVFKFSILNYKS